MKNVKDYGVQEMTTIEMRKTDGGWPKFVLGLLLLDLAKEIIMDGGTKCWEDFKEGFNEGMGE